MILNQILKMNSISKFLDLIDSFYLIKYSKVERKVDSIENIK